jgi:hypothetical protein
MLTASGMCASPVAYVILCVRFVSLVHVCGSCNRLQRSARHATLDMGSWLDLTLQGLSPRKKRQASLVALELIVILQKAGVRKDIVRRSG